MLRIKNLSAGLGMKMVNFVMPKENIDVIIVRVQEDTYHRTSLGFCLYMEKALTCGD